MKTYKVLWFDDEHLTLEIIRDRANINGIKLTSFDNSTDGIAELEKKLYFYDAVIVDGKFFRRPGQSGDTVDDNALKDVAFYLERKKDVKVVPWFILSGQLSFTKEINRWADGFKAKVYDKNIDEHIQSLWDDIKIAADAQFDTQIRHKYANVFDVCAEAYIGTEAAKTLLYLLETVESENDKLETEEKINSIRKLVEKIFAAFNRIGVLPSEVSKSKGGMNSSSKFLCIHECKVV